MKTLLKLEELAMFLLSLASMISFYLVGFIDWWWFLLILIGPDISMLGYLVSNKIGAWCHNFFHHKGIAIILFLLGALFSERYHELARYVMLAGITLFSHSSMDRFFGFGLKTEEGFKFTHLGKIGKKEK